MQFTNQVTATTTPQKLIPGNVRRTALTIFNASATITAYYGSDISLTIGNGMPILPLTGWAMLAGLGDDTTPAIYLIAASTTVDIRFSESMGPEPEKGGV